MMVNLIGPSVSATINNIISLSLGVVLGFSQTEYVTDERPQLEGLGVSVEVLFGQLERSVVVWINSTQDSTATPGQGICVGVNFTMIIHFFTCTY